MAKGDHLVVERIGYSHHGIDCGDGFVIHYAGEPLEKQNACVRLDPYEIFAKGDLVTAREYASCHAPDAVLERARSRIGEQGYNLVFNNCEHFARWCKTGDHDSEQVNDAIAGTTGATGAGAAVAGAVGVVSAAGAAAGLSGAGIMSGLAASGAVVGGGAVAGLGVLGAAPATVSVVAMRGVLRDDAALPQEERDARKAGRVASVAGGAVGTLGTIGAISAAGVPGLSAVGITTGLAAIGGGSMLAGTVVALAAPAVAAAAVGYFVYRLVRAK